MSILDTGPTCASDFWALISALLAVGWGFTWVVRRLIDIYMGRGK